MPVPRASARFECDMQGSIQRSASQVRCPAREIPERSFAVGTSSGCVDDNTLDIPVIYDYVIARIVEV